VRAAYLEAAHLYRMGKIGAAGAALVRANEKLARNLAVLGPRTSTVLASLKAALDAQARGDTVRLADVLEYELAPELAD